MAADGLPLVLAGHTHGGQLRVPGYGALVTNCGLDPRGPVACRYTPTRRWLHVSAGLGTSPYAPVRFACPPGGDAAHAGRALTGRSMTQVGSLRPGSAIRHAIGV